MKKFLLILCIACIVCACNEELPVRQPLQSPSSRSFVTQGTQSVSNPDLIDNWENVKEIKLNRSTDNVVAAPWAAGTQSPLSEAFRTDIKKANGWTMLFHSFEKVGKDAGQNYMCFYNYFTGVLKVFYYYEYNVGASMSQWVLKYDGVGLLQVLDNPGFYCLADDQPSTNTSNTLYLSNESGVQNGALTQGWNGFEYQVPRYSINQKPLSSFSINSVSSFYTNYQFVGNAKFDTSGTITSLTTPRPQSRAGESEQTEQSSIYALNQEKAQNQVKSLGGVIEVGQHVAEFFGPVGKVVSLALGAAKTIFKKSTAMEYVTESNARFESLGTMSLTGAGSIQITNNVSPIAFNFSDVSASNVVASAQLNSSEPFTLGVWTIKKRPKLYVNLITPVTMDRIDDSNEDGLEFYGTTVFPEVVRYDTPEVVFNPIIKQYIKSYNVSVKWVDYKPENETYTNYYNNSFRKPFAADKLIAGKMPYSLYEPTEYKQSIYRVTSIRSRDVDSNTRYYFNWKNIVTGRTIAYVTVSMNVNYLGNQFTITETRRYEPELAVDPGSSMNILHNPPYYYVINSGLDGAANY
ncbi:MAG: hypothetical protein K2I69_04640 [Muribaculaceae bacterium]|nr:hypothetical protein [Muribaculaceae bacterium]